MIRGSALRNRPVPVSLETGDGLCQEGVCVFVARKDGTSGAREAGTGLAFAAVAREMEQDPGRGSSAAGSHAAPYCPFLCSFVPSEVSVLGFLCLCPCSSGRVVLCLAPPCPSPAAGYLFSAPPAGIPCPFCRVSPVLSRAQSSLACPLTGAALRAAGRSVDRQWPGVLWCSCPHSRVPCHVAQLPGPGPEWELLSRLVTL